MVVRLRRSLPPVLALALLALAGASGHATEAVPCATTIGGNRPDLHVVPGPPARRAVRKPPPPSVEALEPGTSAPLPAPDPGPEWKAIGSLSTRQLLGPGERLVVRFDHVGRRLAESAPADPLTPLAARAVERAPSWLADALAANLGQLSAGTQDTLARLVLEATDPYVDEIAFQIARLGVGSLTHRRFDPELLVENARLIYQHDALLQYVEVVDYGSAEEGGDYYSTTRYRATNPSDPGFVKLFEIPRDVYYWYVVHPKLSDETVKRSDETDARQSTYGHFWRSYLFANPDPAHDYTRGPGGSGTYPVLGTVLQEPTLLWDGVPVNHSGGRDFAPDDVALDVVGNWVSTLLPQKASGNRPVQPNQIAYEHNGNCGEIQDLLGAASRTALIPNVLTTNHCEDHVWNEFFVVLPEPAWFPYQVDWAGGATRIANFGVAYDKETGGGKDVSGIWAWRSDGFAYDIVDRYSNAASLAVHVRDAGGKGVDGARVLVFSEAWSGNGYSLATFGHTDGNGWVRFRLGDKQNYYLRVESALGRYPGEENGITRILEDTEADASYEHTVELAGRLRRYADWIQAPTDGDYRLAVRFAATDEVVMGASPFGSQLDFTDWRQPGQVDFLAFDAPNFERYDAAEAATALLATENAPAGEQVLPAGQGDADRYLVLSNEDHVANRQLVRAEVVLYRHVDRTQPGLFLPMVRRGP